MEPMKTRASQPSGTITMDHSDAGDNTDATHTGLDKCVGVLDTADAFGPADKEQGCGTLHSLTTTPHSQK